MVPAAAPLQAATTNAVKVRRPRDMPHTHIRNHGRLRPRVRTPRSSPRTAHTRPNPTTLREIVGLLLILETAPNAKTPGGWCFVRRGRYAAVRGGTLPKLILTDIDSPQHTPCHDGGRRPRPSTLHYRLRC